MTTHLVYLFGGAALLVAVVLPYALRTAALSPPVVLLGLGALIGLLPGTGDSAFSPIAHRGFVEHLAEFTVLIALMGVAGQVLVVPKLTPHKFEVVGPERYIATHIHASETFITEWLEGPRAAHSSPVE